LELIHTFTMVRDDPAGLMAALDGHYPQRKKKPYYLKVRAQRPEDLSSAERAARTIFLNKTCYNGLYRVNGNGQFNVPFGRNLNPSLYDRNTILAASRALKTSILTSGDYRSVCQYARQDDFVYLDPPYHPPSATANFTGYTRHAFGPEDQKEVASVFMELDRRGCKLMLSKSVRATRVINSKVDGRGAIEELLVMNY
jgi:DNA adenine methylase